MLVALVALLSLVPGGRSAPRPCETLLQPLPELRLRGLAGRWALVASGVTDAGLADVLRRRDSVTIDLHNSTYTEANSERGSCFYFHRSFSVEGRELKMASAHFNLTMALYRTSCPDCALVRMDIETPTYKLLDLYLLSRRRRLEQEEMDEFGAQVECLNLLPPVVMDPTKDLCPEETVTDP